MLFEILLFAFLQTPAPSSQPRQPQKLPVAQAPNAPPPANAPPETNPATAYPHAVMVVPAGPNGTCADKREIKLESADKKVWCLRP